MEWTESQVGINDWIYAATGPNGEQYVLLYDNGAESDAPGWLIRTIEIAGDGTPIVVDEGILDTEDRDAIDAAQREAEVYLGVGMP